MNTITFNVEDIAGESDKMKLEEVIGNIEGVGKSNINHETNQVEVVYDMSTVYSSKISQCIEKSGYKITSESHGELDRRSENLGEFE